MLTRDETIRSLAGVWQLFLGRREGMRLLDLSVDGFWRSFRAIILVIPAYAVTALVERNLRIAHLAPGEVFPDGPFVTSKVVALALDWVAMPVILALAARPLGIERTYVGYVVARNWATVLAMIPYAFAALAFGFEVFGSEVSGVISFLVLIVVLRYHYQIARYALGVGVGFAVALVAADFVTSLTIGESIDRLAGLP